MKSGAQVSPAVAGIIIAVVVIVAGFLVWRGATKHPGGNPNPDEFRKAFANSMNGRAAHGAPGSAAYTSPGGAMGGSSAGSPSGGR